MSTSSRHSLKILHQLFMKGLPTLGISIQCSLSQNTLVTQEEDTQDLLYGHQSTLLSFTQEDDALISRTF